MNKTSQTYEKKRHTNKKVGKPVNKSDKLVKKNWQTSEKKVTESHKLLKKSDKLDKKKWKKVTKEYLKIIS